MLFVFNAWTNPSLFQTGWFVKSLLTQTLIIHIIRTAKVPFIESRASPALITTTIIICVVGVTLPFTWAGSALGFTPLPALYWPFVRHVAELRNTSFSWLNCGSCAAGACERSLALFEDCSPGGAFFAKKELRGRD